MDRRSHHGLSVHLSVNVLLLRLIAVLLTFTPIGWIVFILLYNRMDNSTRSFKTPRTDRMEGKPINDANIWSAISKGSTTPANPEAEAKEESQTS